MQCAIEPPQLIVVSWFENSVFTIQVELISNYFDRHDREIKLICIKISM